MTEGNYPGAFGRRLTTQIAERGGLCVGIDPHPGLIEQWGLPHSAAGLAAFGSQVVDAAARVGIAAVKPQVAFFEAYGSAGFAALEGVLREGRDAGLIVIADAKRGDIGSSNTGYAHGWLRADAPFVCDALTVSPYLGVDTLADVAQVALSNGRGLFVLAATSNPEAADIQTAWVSRLGDERRERTVAGSIVRAVRSWNRDELGGDPDAHRGIGSVGVVLGATVDLAARGIKPKRLPGSVPILAPGFGAQGAILMDAQRIFPDTSDRLLASVSRSVLAGAPDGLVERVQAAQAQLVAA